MRRLLFSLVAVAVTGISLAGLSGCCLHMSGVCDCDLDRDPCCARAPWALIYCPNCTGANGNGTNGNCANGKGNCANGNGANGQWSNCNHTYPIVAPILGGAPMTPPNVPIAPAPRKENPREETQSEIQTEPQIEPQLEANK